MLRSLGVLVLSTLLLVACGSEDGDPGGTSGYDQKREWRVAGDAKATADEIIDAGGAVDVARSGEQTLITYRVESDDDEGPQQGAWRLYDTDGKRVADGTLGQVFEAGAVAEVRAAGDRFLLEGYAEPKLISVATDGSTEKITTVSKPRPAKAGDLLLEDGEDAGWYAYRPADHTAYRLPKLPTDQPQGVALDDKGVVWVMLPWDKRTATVASSAGGEKPWRRHRIPLAKGGYPVAQLAASAGKVYFATGAGSDMSPQLDKLWVHPAGSDGKWQEIEPAGIKFKKTTDPQLDVLPDGRLLVYGDLEGPWVQQTSGTFEKIKLPKQAPETSVELAGDRLYTTHNAEHVLLMSDDLGQTWTEVKR